MTAFDFIAMLDVLSLNIPYKLTAIFSAVSAAMLVTMKYNEMGVAVLIALKPVILNPPVIQKHLMTCELSDDLTKLVLTRQCAPELALILVLSKVT